MLGNWIWRVGGYEERKMKNYIIKKKKKVLYIIFLCFRNPEENLRITYIEQFY
jgi:hypothetical protein